MKILKKIFVILIIVLCILSVKSIATTGKINVSATRLRKEKNTTSEILTKIYKNEEVEIVEELGEWVKVKYKDYTGYVKKEFVDVKDEKSENNKNEIKNKNTISNYENETSENTDEVVIIKTSSLRILPNFLSKKIDLIEQGVTLKVVSRLNNWVKVTDGTVIGWIPKIKLNFKTQMAQIEPSDLETKESTDTKNTVSNTIKNTVTNKVENNITNNTVNTTKNEVIKNETTENTKITSVSKTGKINVETAKVRKEPSKNGKLIDFLDEGDIVSITEEVDGWYKVEHEGIKGYVSETLITIIDEKNDISSRSLTNERKEENGIETQESKVENIAEENQDATSKGTITENKVVEYAKKFLGTPYILGGKTPESGFDCSGFTKYVYKNFGYNLASVASGQTSVGKEVSREELQPGDLILFYNEAKTKIGHTGVYIGNGEFVHAANPKRGVVCDNMNTLSYYNERFVTARRIVD